jgi:hypothetical protein
MMITNRQIPIVQTTNILSASQPGIKRCHS